ncbi:MAG TPA: Ig-like domain-containing protein [Terriglobales bacterium]|nr:Ig-like domain-containing protein [Terriglobales bacterium]
MRKNFARPILVCHFLRTATKSAVLVFALLVLSPAAPAQQRIVPLGPPQSPRSSTIINLSGPHLNYYGGRVISNVQVAVVFWTANVNFTTHNQIKGFYSTINNSPYIDMLSEYNTVGLTGFADGMPGSNQTIGRGTVIGPYTIAPSVTGTTVDDSQIISELQAQIAAHNLPDPVTDGSGNVNTLYMVYFPLGYTITLQGFLSCQQFCAYHGTYTNNNLSIPYGVMPDLSAPGCRTGCGSGTTFQNLTSVSTHELAESITDTEVGLVGNTFVRPLAWVDPTGNGQEIGDLCNHIHATLSGYTVQEEWSNAMNSCIAPTGGIPASTTALQISSVPSVPSRLRATVSLTATVTPVAPGPTPTGQITFFDGANPLGTFPLSSGQASLTTYQLRGGFRQIQASYSGDINYAPSFDTKTFRYRPPLSR